MLENLSHFIYFLLELLGAVIAYAYLLKKRKNFLKQLAGAALLVLVVFNSFWLFESNFYGNTATWVVFYGLWCFAVFCSMIAVIRICCQVDWNEAIYCVTCSYLTEHVAYCVRILVHTVTGTSIAEGGTILYVAIHVATYIICYHFFIKRMIRDQHYEASLVQSLWLMLSVLFLVLFMSVVAAVLNFQWIHAIYAIFCFIFVLYSQLNQVKQLTLQTEISMKEQIWMKHNAQFELSKENIDIINRKCHDLKHQGAALRKINNQERQAEIIDSIENSIMIYDSNLDTGNEILDTVLTEKSLICNEKHIALTCVTDVKLLDFMDTIDLYTLFGNALDNAIEGVTKIEDEQSRHISILVHEKIGLIFIQFENPFVGTIGRKENKIISSKPKDGYHGYGIQSIINVAEKYDGFVTIETENQIFLLRITIPTATNSNRSNKV